MIENANKSRCFFNLFRTLETALAAEQTKVTTLETTVAASTTKITTLETALAAEQTKVTTLETTVAASTTKITTLETTGATSTTKITTLETALTASTTKITTLETALAALTARIDNINSACLDDGARRLASAPCGGLKVPTTNDENSDTGSTSNTDIDTTDNSNDESSDTGSNTDTSPPTSKTNQVLVQSLQFTGVQASALLSSSAKKNLESKIASAIGIVATRVNIISIKSVPIQKRQMRSLADDTAVEIVYEITIEGDTAALTAKGIEMSQQGSVMYTAVVEAVAIEAGVDASSVTMTSTPMEEAAPSVSNGFPSSDTDTTDTTDTTVNTNELTIIIVSSAVGGVVGGSILTMIVMYFCRCAKKDYFCRRRTKKNRNVDIEIIEFESTITL
jgi:uncharacterized coiled-coil protein SlyX